MKKYSIILFFALAWVRPARAQLNASAELYKMVLGNFTDDYGIRYSISDTLWQQLPRTKFHILRWNLAQQYLIAKNDANNPGDRGLYTRIDLMRFDGMAPWKWGYCLTAYNAGSDKEAEAKAIADRSNPRKGCNGFPFSRMKVD